MRALLLLIPLLVTGCPGPVDDDDDADDDDATEATDRESGGYLLN
jgi:hypothetical protein